MNLVDVHAHLDFPNLVSDLDKVIESAKRQGVKCIISNGTNPESNRKVLDICKQYDIVKPALGIYPNDGLEMSDDDIKKELEFIEKTKPIAIGECGIDYKNEIDKEKMKSIFEKQILLAKKLNIPVIVHSRKAELDVIELLESFTYGKVMMHCFGGKKHLVKRIIDNGWYLSIPGIVTRLQHFQQIVEMTPITQLLTETDSPFLSPYPNSGRSVF